MRKELETAGRIVASVAMLPGGAVAEKISPPAQVASINSELFLPGGIINWEKVRDNIQLSVTPKQVEKSATSGLNQNSFDLEWHTIAVCDEEPNEVEIKVLNKSDVPFVVTGSIFAQDRGGEIKEISSVPEQYQNCAPGNTCGPEERIVNWYPESFDGDTWGKAEVRYNDVLISEQTLDRTHLHCGIEPTPTPTPAPALKLEWSKFAVCDEQPDEVEIRAHNLNDFTVEVDGVIYAQHDGGEIKVLSAVPEQYRSCDPDKWCGPDERIRNQYEWFDGDVWGEAVVTYNGIEVKEVMDRTHLECGIEPTATPTATKTSKPTATATPTRTSVGPTATATRTPRATETPKKTSVKPTATERPVVNQTPVAPATGSRESRNGELTAGLLAAGLAAAAIEGIRRKNRKAQS